MYSAGDIEAVATLNDAQYRKKLGEMPGVARNALAGFAKLAAGYLSFRAGIAAVKDTVGAFIVQEDAVNGVRAALRKQGQEYNLQTQELEKYAGELQKVTTYGDEATLATMAQGMNMGISSGAIKDATKAAMGLAAAYNMDLNTAMQLVAKANAGNTAALSRYGIKIDESKSKQERFNDVLKRGADGFQIAEANAKTTGGQLKQMGNAWGDLKEVVGEFIVALFGVGDASGDATQMISEATSYIKDNLDEWVFEIKYVYAYFEAGIKAIWAIFEPAVTYSWQWFKAGINNIVAIAKWGFENAGKIWENLPDIFIGICKDIVQFFKNAFDGLLNLTVNFVKAVLTAIKGGGIEGFKDLWEQMCVDAVKTIKESGRFTEEALAKAGISAFPEMQTGNFGEMVEKYKNIGDTLSQIDKDRAVKQARFEDEYKKKLAQKKQRMQDKKGAGVEAEGKRNTVGNFSAAILAAQLGGGSPMAETAKNTRELVQIQKRQMFDDGGGVTVG